MVRDLEREVFGGSESELSSDEGEDELQREQIRQPHGQSLSAPQTGSRPSFTKPRSAERTAHSQDYESSAGSEDEYVNEPRRSASVGKARKKPKKSMRASAEGGDNVGNKPASRKRKRKPVVEVDLNDLPPEQANKLRIDMKIDEILRGSKKTNRPRKKKNNEESLDTFGDVEVARLREAMNNAADEDIRSNSEKLPATAKLKLLPEAMETLRKASLAQSMIDNNLLEAVRRWLEPLPDRSLPALNIQREFFGVIKKMEFIDSTVLKESGLGRVVLFYTKCKRVTPDISRTANELVSTWSRPIIKRSASYRDRVVPSASVGEHGEVDMRAGEKLNAILKRAAEAEKGKVRRSNAVMIPQRELGTYTVAPKMNAGIARGNTSVDIDTERRRKNAERMRTLTRRVGTK
ncbi:hypothetical protein D9613_007654 [Agrocybe pediades]|uniref:TFIIS N-terminal domain-containing protein n=1 Tax=Agrocybe pediades TaxID=84607 RepID=A0A8H4QNF4_9AGAR|nr:hypothetical protein D9613_007654 [Agrocybe pediades]